MPVLSIQSGVAYGHVGNAAATFPLQRLGREVWAVDTVTFSNHPAHGGWRGRVHPAEDVREILRGIGERGAFARCEAVLSGYLGEAATGEAVLETVDAVKAANADALYCLDPVMGEAEGGLYVRPGIPEFFRERALPLADLVLPNAFELAHLAGAEAATPQAARTAAEELRRRGPDAVVVTGLAAADEVGTLAVSGEGAWLGTTPRVPVPAHGAGDLFAALFLGHFLESREVPAALGRAVSAVYGVLRETERRGADAPAIVEAQGEIVSPGRLFTPAPL